MSLTLFSLLACLLCVVEKWIVVPMLLFSIRLPLSTSHDAVGGDWEESMMGFGGKMHPSIRGFPREAPLRLVPRAKEASRGSAPPRVGVVGRRPVLVYALLLLLLLLS